MSILQKDLSSNSLRQSYLVISCDREYLDALARDFSGNFLVADTFWLTAKEDAKSIQVAETLDFTRKVQMAAVGKKKLYIISYVCAMTVAAQNKILKVLEDTRDDCVFLLLCHDPERVLPTIKSRCVQIQGKKKEISHIDNNLIQSAEGFLKCNTLDDKLRFLATLTIDLPKSMQAINSVVSQHLSSIPSAAEAKRLLAVLETMSTINLRQVANCNAQNAFDLLTMV